MESLIGQVVNTIKSYLDPSKFEVYEEVNRRKGKVEDEIIIVPKEDVTFLTSDYSFEVISGDEEVMIDLKDHLVRFKKGKKNYEVELPKRSIPKFRFDITNQKLINFSIQIRE